jgi:hypothetical protein
MPPLEDHTPAQQQFHRFLDDKFFCPRCGKGPEEEGLFIEDKVCPQDRTAQWSECEVLHRGDLCVCDSCGWSGTATRVAAAYKKKHNLKPCQHCGGTGFEREP